MLWYTYTFYNYHRTGQMALLVKGFCWETYLVTWDQSLGLTW